MYRDVLLWLGKWVLIGGLLVSSYIGVYKVGYKNGIKDADTGDFWGWYYKIDGVNYKGER